MGAVRYLRTSCKVAIMNRTQLTTVVLTVADVTGKPRTGSPTSAIKLFANVGTFVSPVMCIDLELHPSANDVSKCTESAIAKFFKMLTSALPRRASILRIREVREVDVAGGARNLAQTGFDCPREITCPQVIAQAFEIAHSKS